MCHHPGIIKIISTFQTKNKLFFVLEYAQNRDLDFIMRKFGSLPDDLAVCYLSEIVNVLDYLHNKMKISHNDLKPSNIMLDDDYHLKLIDFSTAKIVGKRFDSKTKNFIDDPKYIDKEIVGTAEYCSPEMINQAINDYRTNDIWALGIMMYYFYHGKTPFRGSNDFQTFKNIKEGKYSLNLLVLSEEAKDLIQNLLVIDSTKRLNITKVKEHPYFKDINWETLRNNTVPIPKDLLAKFTNKLSTGDSNTDFWTHFCNEINKLAPKEYEIIKIDDYLIDDNFYYGKENINKVEETGGNKRRVIYEGILTKIGLINNFVKIKLFSDKTMELWNNGKKNNLIKIIKLDNKVDVQLENEIYIKLTCGKKTFTFKTTKLEAVKWYNFFNQVIYS